MNSANETRRPQTWSAIKIAIVAFVFAVAMSSTVVHFGRQVDRERIHQIRMARLSSMAATVLGDMDSFLLGEKAADFKPNYRHMVLAWRNLAELDTEEISEISDSYAAYLKAIEQETLAVTSHNLSRAKQIDRDVTDPAYERFKDAIAQQDRRCEAEAAHGIKLLATSSLLSLLSGACLLSGFAIRLKQRSASMAILELQRRSSQSSEGRFRFLYELAEAKRGLTEPKAIVDIVTKMLREYLGATHGTYAIQTERGLNVYSSTCAIEGEPFSWNAEVISALQSNGGYPRLVVVKNVEKDLPRATAEKFIAESIGAFVACPVVNEKRLEAVLYFQQSETRAWTDEEVSLVEEVTARCWSSIRRAEAELAAHQSEVHARFVLDASTDGIWELNFETGDVVWSESMFAMLGLVPGEFTPTYHAQRDLIHPDDLSAFDAVMSDCLFSHETYNLRLRFQKPDGQWLTLAAQGRTQRSGAGTPIRTVGTLKDLTVLFEAEEAQRKIEYKSRWTSALLEAQINASIDGILIVDEEGRQILQNQRMAEVWDIPAEIAQSEDDWRQVEYVTSKVKDPVAFVNGVRELYANPLEIRRDEIELKSGTVLDRFSGPALGSDGTIYGRIWTFRDITDRIRAENSIRQNEERLVRLMESIPQIVWTCLPDGWNLYFNERWTEYTGLCEDESGGLGWKQAFHPDDQTTGSHATTDPIPYEVECRLRSKDGTYRWFLIRGTPLLDADKTVVQWFGTCTDIDDLKQSEENLEARVELRTHELSLATQEATRANAAKSEFLSRMSHELRTPLNAILGFGQILERGELDELQQESVHYILKGGRHLLGLINEILDLSRVESGRSDLSIEPVPLGEVLDESLSMIRNAAANLEIQIEENLHEAEGVHVRADRQRLKQVLINLLSNAVKYNRPSGQLIVRCQPEDAEILRISIQDTGYGICEEGLSKLFTPFERLNAAAGIEGTGLGLFLTKRLVSAMGGNLEVTSILDEGSTFSVLLQLSKAPTELLAAHEDRDLVALSPLSEGRTYKVLSIEDNAANTRLLEAVLVHRPNVELLSAQDGFSGLDLARRIDPDLILLDLNLPDISGTEVLIRLKRSASTSSIPIIVVSADASEENVGANLKAGASAFLPKPLDLDRFLRHLDEALLGPTDTLRQVA